jgi:FkbM family methyltransferase
VGAHIGTFSIPALADRRFARVLSFEPNPETFGILRHNLSLNSGSHEAFPWALGGEVQSRVLNLPPPANKGLASLAVGHGLGAIQIDEVTVDSLVLDRGFPAPSMMKIDVEGWELNVLEGARRILATRPPKAMVVEAECDEEGRIVDGSLKQFLSSHGYRLERLRRPSGAIERRENYAAILGDR